MTKNPDRTRIQVIDWIYYFFNTMKLTADTYLHSLLAKDIESFRYLAYFLEKEKKKNSVYINISDYNSLANQGKKHAVIIKVDDKRIKFLPINVTRFYAPFHFHMNRGKNIVKNLKFLDKKISLPLNLPSFLISMSMNTS